MKYHFLATWATTRRILQQLVHDPRTLGLLFVVPCLLLTLLAWLFNGKTQLFNSIGPVLLAIFPLMIMFLITSIATLRERSSGTLERVLTTPISRFDFILGYALAFGFLALIQATIASFLCLTLLGLNVAGPEWLILLIAVIDALLGMALGLFVSAFAKSEFQAVQFLPSLLFPQLLLCGLFLPLNQMPSSLDFIAHCLPMTYAVQAMHNVSVQATVSSETLHDCLIVIGCVLLAVALGTLTLRRRSR